MDWRSGFVVFRSGRGICGRRAGWTAFLSYAYVGGGRGQVNGYVESLHQVRVLRCKEADWSNVPLSPSHGTRIPSPNRSQ